jgi:branched-chain amino acid transport system ATP-binding protein
MALSMEASVVLMDEPTAALVGNLATEVLDGIGTYARSKGIGVLLVEQDVEQARRVADSEINLVGGTGRVALSARRFRGMASEGDET